MMKTLLPFVIALASISQLHSVVQSRPLPYPQTACILRFQDMHCTHLGELFGQTNVVPTDAGHLQWSHDTTVSYEAVGIRNQARDLLHPFWTSLGCHNSHSRQAVAGCPSILQFSQSSKIACDFVQTMPSSYCLSLLYNDDKVQQ